MRYKSSGRRNYSSCSKSNTKRYEYSKHSSACSNVPYKCGDKCINKKLQALINPPAKGKREIKVFDDFFRVGDKVIQLVNQPEDGVSNGDIGEIVAIFKANENVDKKEEIVIAYDDLEVTYRRNEFQNIALAYCISIHKSQGSEFPIV